MLSTGESAPSFALPGTDGETISEYRLASFTERGALVLLFYPFDYSPVCTQELCNFRDSEWLSFTDDLDVVGVSTDSAFAHRNIIQENGLPFPLLSDHDGTVSERYGVLYDELEGHPRVSKRAVFVVDDRQTLQYVWVADDWLTDPDVGAVHEAVTGLNAVEM
jgi:peroxiredoxin